MRKVIQAKHWQIFLALVIPSFFQGMGTNVFFDIFLYCLHILFYIGWLLLLGAWLRGVSSNPKMNYGLFIGVGLALVSVLISYRILEALDILTPDVFGDTFVTLSMMCYILGSLIVLASFIGKNLKTLEIGDDVDINDYFNDILSLIFWPIGIWMFQPRINKLERRLSGNVSKDSNTDRDSRDALDQNAYVSQTFAPGTINRLIGYGILVFLIGFFLGVNWIKSVQLLIPIGSLMTFFGAFYFLKQTNLQEEFRMNPKDDVLTYFWDVLVLKLWTCMFLIWMIVMNLMLIKGGWL